MGSLQKFLHFSFLFTLSIFYGSLILLRVLWTLATKGRKVLHKKTRQELPPCLQDPSLGTHHFIKLQDVKLHYVSSGPEDAPLMLFVHGFPEFWYSWRHQIREFQKKYRCVAIDMRGYGDSDKPSGIDNYNVKKLAEDVAQIVPSLGYKKCVLVGHDWGGAVTWRVAQTHPEVVERLINCNIPHPTAMAKTLQSSWKQFLMSWYMFFFQLPYFPEFVIGMDDYFMLKQMFVGKEAGLKMREKGGMTDDDIEAFVYTFQKNGFTAPLNYYRSALRTMPVRPKSGSTNISLPVCLIWGTKDGALSSPMAELSEKYCSDFTLRWIEGASHWVQQDDPEAVNKAMWDFLKK